MKKGQPKDMTFVLKRKNPPPSWMLNTRNTTSNPLHYFDEKKGESRVLRYASNQRSVFEDEQKGEVIVKPIIFEDGLLFVPKTNPTLQEFLTLHPKFEKEYTLRNLEKDAQEEVDNLSKLAEATSIAASMNMDKMMSIARVNLGLNVDKYSMPEIKRDVMMFAKNKPSEFLESVNDPSLDFADLVSQIFQRGLLKTRKNDTQVWFNLDSNKTKMLDLQFGDDVKSAVAAYLKSDEGIPVMDKFKAILSI